MTNQVIRQSFSFHQPAFAAWWVKRGKEKMTLRSIDKKRCDHVQTMVEADPLNSEVWYIHSVLAQCFLPYRNQKGVTHWVRENGKAALAVTADTTGGCIKSFPRRSCDKTGGYYAGFVTNLCGSPYWARVWRHLPIVLFLMYNALEQPPFRPGGCSFQQMSDAGYKGPLNHSGGALGVSQTHERALTNCSTKVREGGVHLAVYLRANRYTSWFICTAGRCMYK